MAVEPTVMIVEDNLEMRESLQFMLEAKGLSVEVYAEPAELIDKYDPNRPGCLILDLRLPNLSGLDLQQKLRSMGGRHPFVVITGHGDVPIAVQAMREGAVDFIQKPFDRQQLLRRVDEALKSDDVQRQKRAEAEDVERRINSLTPREREVMDLVVNGKLTKQIASLLGISPKTVEVHRSNVTRKMETDSVAQLVKLVSRHRNSLEEGAA